MTGRFDGRVAAITGGGGGVGAAVGARLAAEGARVTLLDIDAGKAAAAAVEIGSGATGAGLDVTDPDAVAAAMQLIADRGGRLDIVVASAAIPMRAPILEIEPALWRRVIDTNLSGVFFCSQAAARIMAAAGFGRIVHISSVNGQRAVSGRGAYAAAKGGVEMLTKIMAAELADRGVTVNGVAPAPVETEMIRQMHGPETRREWERVLPMRRYANPEEVAGAVAYLCSDEAGYVTGHTLNVDGGFNAAGLLIGR